LAFSQAQTALGSSQRWQLHYERDFYRWCRDQQFPYFSADVALRLDGLVIGGNPKGEAVRSADPDEGPLDAMEVASLALALRAARIENSMPLTEQAAVWLALAFGANASQYALMREEDVDPQYLNGLLVATLVHVPRHKKGHVQPRTDFRTRKANRFVGRLLLDLIKSNEEEHPTYASDGGRPLFWRSEPLVRGDDLHEWVWHLTANEFTLLLQKAVKRLRVLSRTGKLLHISPRRLRYSMASRMVQEGASKYAVAAALDHTDLQHVDTYFDVASNIVDHLDRVLALELGARAQSFVKLVEKEGDAVNGDKATSRRYYADREKELFEPIGTCSHSFLCNVSAPYGCYACPKFQAWMDGPHELVLDALIESRNRREQLGLDLRIVAIEDELIIQVADVIRRIAARRGEVVAPS
jgi:integrase